MREDFNIDWETRTLGDISIISMGQSPSSSSYNTDGHGSYLIQGNADIKNRKSSPRQWTSEPTKSCEIGDILMTVRAPVGAIAKAVHEACIGRGVCSIKANSVDDGFLYQYLLSYEDKWKSLEQGSTFTAVNGTEIKNLTIPFPPLPEQQKIAEILSTVDDEIDVIDQQISETQALKKGLMQRLLAKGIGHTDFKDSPLGKIPKSWFSSTIEKSCEIHNSKREPISAEIRKGMQGIYPYYGPTKAVDFINQYAFDGDYVLIGEDGDHFLKYENWSMTQFVHGKFNVNNHAHIITGKIGCLTEWIHYFFQHRDIVKFLTRQGAGRYKLTKATLMVMILAIPPVEEQKKIVEILSSVDEKLEVLEDKKTHYQELKQGLMQQFLAGKISVNGLINKTYHA
jgi:type I restriction enzyme, S subunit